MLLNHQVTGSGSPLRIGHGLFGTLENWGSQIKTLSEHYQVIAVDLRNHGKSPRSDVFDYQVMADDIIELMDHLGLDQIDLMGHSMGGKVSMLVAMQHPERIQRLILVDIAPVQYPRHHDDVIEGLKSVNLATLKSRQEADKVLAEYVDDLSVRAFLLKNLYRNEQKQFAWRINIDVISDQYDNIAKAPEGTPYTGPTLFIKGANSHYIKADYQDAILTSFPNATYKIIQGAGHWPHAEKPVAFSKTVEGFLKG